MYVRQTMQNHAAAMAVATKPAALYNPLSFMVIPDWENSPVYTQFVTKFKKIIQIPTLSISKAMNLPMNLIEAIRRGTTAEFRQKYRNLTFC